jgi:hypothetical protein
MVFRVSVYGQLSSLTLMLKWEDEKQFSDVDEELSNVTNFWSCPFLAQDFC